MATKKSVFGIFSARNATEIAINALRDDGFEPTEISLLVPEIVAPTEPVTETEKETKETEGSGAVINGTLGWLVGIGALVIPGFGSFLAAGPIMAALAGTGAGGEVVGFPGALVGFGATENEASRYEGHLQKGGLLLAVHCDSPERIDNAKLIMERSGAEEVSVASQPPIVSKPTDIQEARQAASGN